MRMLTALLCALASPTMAEDWKPLDQGSIALALSARVLQYEDGATQNFHSDGRTLYQVGTGTSRGKWWIEGGQYCSTWPPSEVKSCFSVEASDLLIRFIGAGGDVMVGKYVDL